MIIPARPSAYEQFIGGLKELSDSDLDHVMAGLTDQDVAYLDSWEARLRDKQVPSSIDPGWSLAVACAGRGWGKTISGACWIKERVLGGAQRIALVGATARQVREAMIDGPSGLLEVFPGCRFVEARARLYFPNGRYATLHSGESPDSMRSINADTVWVDEVAAMQYPMEVLDQVRIITRQKGRVGLQTKVYVTTTPIGNEATRLLVRGDDTAVWPGCRCCCEQRLPGMCSDQRYRPGTDRHLLVHATSFENSANLSDDANAYYDALSKTRFGRQEILAQLLLDVPGALWTKELLDATRVEKVPTNVLKRIVCVDPAVSTNEGSDLTGLVVVYMALGPSPWGGGRLSPHAYIVHDASDKYSPNQQGRKINDLNLEFGPFHLALYETNQGGMYIESAIRGQNPGLHVEGVRAITDKAKRAFQTATNFELGLCHLVGRHPKLEEQLCTWSSDPNAKKQKSPDRLDAMVHGCNYLVPPQRSTGAPGGFIPG